MKSNIPKIGFGTYRLKGELCFNAVSDALKCGYRLFDTATVYGNEEDVGKAISLSSIPRENLFISSKLWFPYRNIEEAVLQSCNLLKMDYIDLYLIHKPNSIMHYEHLNAFIQLKNC